MPVVDVMDDTFLRAPRAEVRRATSARWAGWLPDLDLVVARDRGEQGVRWAASARGPGRGLGRASGRGPGRGRLHGSAEVWLEDVPGGTVAHLYVRLDPVPRDPAGTEPTAGTGRFARDLPDRVRRTWKRGLHAWKDSQEGDRSR